MQILPIVIAFIAFIVTSVLSIKAMGNVYSFGQKCFTIGMIAAFMFITCVDFELALQ